MFISFFNSHREKFNYLIVGVWNTVFGYFAFVALYYLFNQSIHYLPLLVLSNILSITNAYIGYKIFVFKTQGNHFNEYLRFYMVYGFSIALNLVLLPLIVEIFKISPVFAQAFVIFFTMIISYFGHKYFSFAGIEQ